MEVKLKAAEQVQTVSTRTDDEAAGRKRRFLSEVAKIPEIPVDQHEETLQKQVRALDLQSNRYDNIILISFFLLYTKLENAGPSGKSGVSRFFGDVTNKMMRNLGAQKRGVYGKLANEDARSLYS